MTKKNVEANMENDRKINGWVILSWLCAAVYILLAAVFDYYMFYPMLIEAFHKQDQFLIILNIVMIVLFNGFVVFGGVVTFIKLAKEF